MSDLPNITEDHSEFFGSLDPLDHISWSLYQDLLQSDGACESKNEEVNDSGATMDSGAGVVDDNGLKQMKISSPKSKTRKKNSNIGDGINGGMEEGPSVAKKMDHNARERIRRMKLNASYLALRALLPDSRRSKKRWSAPAVVDRVLKYIPELENEVEALRSSKENLQLEAKKKIAVGTPSSEYQTRTVSVNRVNEDEAIVQICMAREDEVLAKLLQNVEDEDICIKSVSSLYVCDTRLCYHLHIQIKSRSEGRESYIVEELRDKVVSWLK